MKYLVRLFLFNVFAIWFTSQILPALVIVGSWQVIIVAGFVLSVLTLIVQPILRILFIPINILTLGLLSWLINVVVIYLLTVLVPEVLIKPWTFPGFSWEGFSVPPFHLTYIVALIIVSVSITFFSNLLHTISED